jgi:hypothetical protein
LNIFSYYFKIYVIFIKEKQILSKNMRLLIFLILVLLLPGCGSRSVSVTVDSICSFNAKEKKKYILLPGNENCKKSDLQFIEFAEYTHKALQSAGFVKASTLDEADVGILLCYGISEPHLYQYTYSLPVYGQTGISASHSQGTVNTFGNTTMYSGQTNYTPSYGVVGSSTHIGTSIFFARYLALSGYDLKKFKKTNKLDDLEELWSTKANSVGETGDLRLIFPILLAASQNHIASSTGKKINYELKESDERVQNLKKENS